MGCESHPMSNPSFGQSYSASTPVYETPFRIPTIGVAGPIS